MFLTCSFYVAIFSPHDPRCRTQPTHPTPLLQFATTVRRLPVPGSGFRRRTTRFKPLPGQAAASTFVVKIAGNSLDRAGIHNGNFAVVDRSLQATSGDIVVVVLYGELLVKRLRYAGEQPILEPDSTDTSYEPYPLPSGADFEIGGVVTNSIRQHRA